MQARELLNLLTVAERLKDTTRQLLHVKRKTGKCCGTQLDDDIDGVFYEG